MYRTSFAVTVRQDHNGFFDLGNGHETFEPIKSRKPRLSETQGASTLFNGKTDFQVNQERRRKEHKPVRHARTEWEYPHQKTNVGAEKGRYMGEEL